MDLFASRIFHQVSACTSLYSYTTFFNKQGSEEREAKNGYDFYDRIHKATHTS